MEAHVHGDRDPIARCTRCGVLLCAVCRKERDGRALCSNCLRGGGEVVPALRIVTHPIPPAMPVTVRRAPRALPLPPSPPPTPAVPPARPAAAGVFRGILRVACVVGSAGLLVGLAHVAGAPFSPALAVSVVLIGLGLGMALGRRTNRINRRCELTPAPKPAEPSPGVNLDRRADRAALAEQLGA